MRQIILRKIPRTLLNDRIRNGSNNPRILFQEFNYNWKTKKKNREVLMFNYFCKSSKDVVLIFSMSTVHGVKVLLPFLTPQKTNNLHNVFLLVSDITNSLLITSPTEKSKLNSFTRTISPLVESPRQILAYFTQARRFYFMKYLFNFLVANSNSSNYCSPSVCLSVTHTLWHMKYFQYGWI